MDTYLIPLLLSPRCNNQCVDLPTLYALSKNGSIRVYEISVIDMGDHAVMTTSKRVTLAGKVTTDRYEYWEGVNIGKSNETTYLEQAISEAKSSWNSLKDAGFIEEIPDTSLKFNKDANGIIKPMLAVSYNEDKIVFPCIVQPKFDGTRCLLISNSKGVSILSRKGKPYNIPHLKKWAEEHIDLLPLDGELYNHKELTFQEIVSAVKKVSPITEKIKYVVYDRPESGFINFERWRTLLKDFEDSPKDSPVYISDCEYCANMDDIKRYHAKCVSEGYEGVIIRNYTGEYEFGFRSNDLIKLKMFDDAEFKIIGVEEATGRDSGTAVFVCECEGGIFRAKPQGTRELRSQYFSERTKIVGKMVTVQYQGLSDSGIPRFPSAVAIRDYE